MTDEALGKELISQRAPRARNSSVIGGETQKVGPAERQVETSWPDGLR